jgi:hypothetical protein
MDFLAEIVYALVGGLAALRIFVFLITRVLRGVEALFKGASGVVDTWSSFRSSVLRARRSARTEGWGGLTPTPAAPDVKPVTPAPSASSGTTS